MDKDLSSIDATQRLLNRAAAAYLVVEANYAPRHAAEAPSWAARLIGLRCQWFGGWKIEGGPYAGQWAMVPVYRGARRRAAEPGPRWVPLEHLRQIRVIGCPGEVRGERARREPRVG